MWICVFSWSSISSFLLLHLLHYILLFSAFLFLFFRLISFSFSFSVPRCLSSLSIYYRPSCCRWFSSSSSPSSSSFSFSYFSSALSPNPFLFRTLLWPLSSSYSPSHRFLFMSVFDPLHWRLYNCTQSVVGGLRCDLKTPPVSADTGKLHRKHAGEALVWRT